MRRPTLELSPAPALADRWHARRRLIAQALGLALVGACLVLNPAAALDAGAPLTSRLGDGDSVADTTNKAGQPPAARRANFDREQPSADARHLADWVLDSGDNRGTPFVIVDKVNSRVFVFDRHGRLRGATSALLGLAQGDESVPGIGSRKMSTIRPEERTTPAGRFVASQERSLHGEEILWVDYEAAIALHPVIEMPKERRLQRLASLTALDRRITYGCINVPVTFYKNIISPAFKGTSGIVYVLPETRSAREVFGSYDVGEKTGLR